MKAIHNNRALCAIALSCGLAACSESDSPVAPGTDADADAGSFVIAATVQGSDATACVLLTAASLDEGSVSPDGNGLVNDGASQWVFHGTDYLYALTYNQGNAATTRSYILDNDGEIVPRDMEYKVSRYTSFGICGEYIMTMSTGDGPETQADANGYLPKTLLLTYLDVANETSRSNDTSTGAYSLENFLGNGEYVTLAGLQQSGGRLFTGVIPMGLSRYGSASEGGKWIRSGYEDLVKTADGGSNSSKYYKGELQWTQYPDECRVAVFDNESMTAPRIITTDRLSYPCGRFKSQYYQTVWAADNGDIYVFSPSYAKTMTDPRQQTTLPAAVARIPAGADDFDSYYCDIEALSGGRSFMRCQPAGGERFLLQMYDRPFSEKGFAATELAIFDAAARTLTDVTGLPDNITSLGKTIFTDNGSVYIAVNTDDSYPAIYRIDPATAQASRGLTVEATEITAIGRLTPRKTVQ